MSALLTRDVVQQAIELCLPSIMTLLESDLTKRVCMHLVVPDPTATLDGKTFTDIILKEHSINRGNWGEYKFQEFARAKAEQSFHSGLPSRARQETPALYTHGEIKYGGSAVYKGVIVGASGVQPYFDELIAFWVAATCHALSTHALQPILANPDKAFILP